LPKFPTNITLFTPAISSCLILRLKLVIKN
jgi:hypothetical protein